MLLLFAFFLIIIDLYPPHSVLILKCISHKIDVCGEKNKTLGKAVKWTIVRTKRSFVLRSFDAVTFFPAKCQDHSNDYNARVGYAFFSLFAK